MWREKLNLALGLVSEYRVEEKKRAGRSFVLANERFQFPPLMEASGSHRVHHQSRISSDSCDTTGTSSRHSEVPKILVPSCCASEGDCPEKSAGLPLVSFCVSPFRGE